MKSFTVINDGQETIYEGFSNIGDNVVYYVVLVQQEDVIETYAVDCNHLPKDLTRYLVDRDIPFGIIGVFKRTPTIELLECQDCGSYNIAVEAFVHQREDGKLEVGDLCDKGHTCNECGSTNVE